MAEKKLQVSTKCTKSESGFRQLLEEEETTTTVDQKHEWLGGWKSMFDVEAAVGCESACQLKGALCVGIIIGMPLLVGGIFALASDIVV